MSATTEAPFPAGGADVFSLAFPAGVTSVVNLAGTAGLTVKDGAYGSLATAGPAPNYTGRTYPGGLRIAFVSVGGADIQMRVTAPAGPAYASFFLTALIGSAPGYKVTQFVIITGQTLLVPRTLQILGGAAFSQDIAFASDYTWGDGSSTVTAVGLPGWVDCRTFYEQGVVRLSGVAPNTPGFSANFSLALSLIIPNGHSLTVFPPQTGFQLAIIPAVYWIGAPYTADAIAGAAFGWNWPTKLAVAGLTFSIVSAPAWLARMGNNLAGTPPLETAGTTAVVVLSAAFGGTTPQTTTLTITINPPGPGGGGSDSLWIGAPFTLSAIAAEAFTWSYLTRIVHPGTNVLLNAGPPEWVYTAGGAIHGTPPESAIGTSVVIHLSASLGARTEATTLTLAIIGPTADHPLWLGPPFTAGIFGQILPDGSLAFWDANEHAVAGCAFSIPGSDKHHFKVDGSHFLYDDSYPTTIPEYPIILPIQATLGGVVDTTTLTIQNGDPPTIMSLFINSPYTLTATEGKSFLLTVLTVDEATTVNVTGHLLPWLVYAPDTKSFSGTPPFGSGDTIVVVGLEAQLEGVTETTTLTISILPLAVFGATLDVRNGGVAFDAGQPTIKHGDVVTLLVNIIPTEQASGVTNLVYRLRDPESATRYGELLFNGNSARVGSSNAFQFAAQRFAGAGLDRSLALLDDVKIIDALPYELEFEYSLNSNDRTSRKAVIMIERDFGLATDSAGTGDFESGAGGPTVDPMIPVGAFNVTGSLGGVPTAGQLFARYLLPVQTTIIGLQVEVQSADPDADLHVVLCLGDGTGLGSGYGAQLDAGETFATVDFSAFALSLAAGVTICAKVDSYTGTGDHPVQNLTVRILCR